MSPGDARALAELGPLLDLALELPPEARPAWLAELRLARPAAADELEAMLGREDEITARGFLAGRPGELLLAPVPPGGGRLGAYTLVRPLGQGGMGSVWLGRRVDGRFDGEVAIKLLSFALMSASASERFRREGQTLARLTHPNIGRLIDAGVSEAGHAYLVLEYVDGTRIDQYCDERRLPLRARLVLFRQLLAAVAHAHAGLVVHRDIKPSNVLVTRDGQVKLLDFGIAKLLDAGAPSAEPTALTRDGGLPFTAEYAAPEQLTGGPATAAMDVYALGVVLYQLLSGSHPSGPGPRTAAQHIRATIDVEATRVSAAVLDAEARGSTPDRLKRLLSGDLESVVSVALQKDPGQRYASVAAFADDIDRYLGHVPVHARRASAAYRARKFVRRHRAAVTVGMLTALALLGATLATSTQMLEARRQRDLARVERDRAIDQEQRATASSGFMDFLLEDIATSGRKYTTREVIDRADVLLSKEYRRNPRFAARMMIDLSTQYYRLRERARQYALLERANTLATAAGDAETVASANCWMGLTRAFDGEVAVARRQLELADRMLARVPDAPLAVRLRCLIARSNLSRELGHADSALGFARAAVALSSAAGDTASYRHQAVLNELAGALTTARRYRDALGVTRASIALLGRTGRDSTATMVVERYNEARALASLGEFAESDRQLKSTMQLAESMNPQRRVPTYMETLAGDLADELTGPPQARRMLERATHDAELQGDQAGESRALASLIRVLLYAGATERAAMEMRALASLLRDGEGTVLVLLDAHRAFAAADWATAQRRFTEYLGGQGRAGTGRPVYRSPRVATLAARAGLNARDLVAADTLAGLALRLARAEGADDRRSAVVGDALVIQAQVRRARDQPRAAAQLLDRALIALQAGYGPAHWRVREARVALDSLTSASR